MARHLNLPKYVQAFTRAGKRRHYFRRRGYKKVALPGEPWSAEFMSVYAAALAGEKLEIGRGRAEPGSVSSIVIAYLASENFRNIVSAETKRTHRQILERFADSHGALPFRKLDKEGVGRVLNSMAATPAPKRNLRNVLRRMMRWAVEEKIIASDPTEGIRTPLLKSDGWHTMTDAEREQFRQHHPIGTKARAAFELFFYTALRCSDARRLGPQHVIGGVLDLVQQKTSDPVTQPVNETMMAAIAAADMTPVGNVTPLAFLLTKDGLPYTAKGMSNAMKKWLGQAGVPHCSAHSIRKGTLTMLAEKGRSMHQIAAHGGHRSLKMVEAYTKKAERLRLARDAAKGFEPEKGTEVSTVTESGDRKERKA